MGADVREKRTEERRFYATEAELADGFNNLPTATGEASLPRSSSVRAHERLGSSLSSSDLDRVSRRFGDAGQSHTVGSEALSDESGNACGVASIRARGAEQVHFASTFPPSPLSSFVTPL